jgi:hypothetical protein
LTRTDHRQKGLHIRRECVQDVGDVGNASSTLLNLSDWLGSSNDGHGESHGTNEESGDAREQHLVAYARCC